MSVNILYPLQVLLWNLPKVRPLWTYSLQDTQEDDAHPQKAGQMFNPPLAHCIDVASCSNVFACAAEDGCIHLLRVSEDARLKERGMFKAHCQGASQAHFISFLSHLYWLATGRNDGLVALWDLSEDALVANERKRKSRKKKPKARAKTVSQVQGSDQNTSQMSGEEAEAGSASSRDTWKNCAKTVFQSRGESELGLSSCVEGKAESAGSGPKFKPICVFAG